MDSTFYLLDELDGTPLKRKYAGEHVKKYFPHMPWVQQILDRLANSNTSDNNDTGEVEG
jgi:hypothetical protein